MDEYLVRKFLLESLKLIGLDGRMPLVIIAVKDGAAVGSREEEVWECEKM